MIQYSFSKGLVKALISIAIVGLPIVIQLLPNDISNLTLSGAILLLVNYLKVQSA